MAEAAKEREGHLREWGRGRDGKRERRKHGGKQSHFGYSALSYMLVALTNESN